MKNTEKIIKEVKRLSKNTYSKIDIHHGEENTYIRLFLNSNDDFTWIKNLLIIPEIGINIDSEGALNIWFKRYEISEDSVRKILNANFIYSTQDNFKG